MGKGKQLQLNVPGQTDSRKFRMKYIGPYKVEEQVSKVAYRLSLPKHMKVHPVFHVDRLRPWKQSSRALRPATDGTKAVNNEGTEFTVEKLLRTRTVRRGKATVRQFLVKWQGYPVHEATWEPETNLHCERLKREFWARMRGGNSGENAA